MMRAFCIPIGRLQRFSIMKIKKDQSIVYDNKHTVKSVLINDYNGWAIFDCGSFSWLNSQRNIRQTLTDY